MRQNPAELAVAARQLHRAPVDVDVAAGQGEGVYLPEIEDPEMVGNAPARMPGQPLAEALNAALHGRVARERVAALHLHGRPAAQLHFLFWAESEDLGAGRRGLEQEEQEKPRHQKTPRALPDHSHV